MTDRPQLRVLPALDPEDLEPESLIRIAIEQLREQESTSHRDRAIARLEEALLWLHAEEVI